MSAHKSPKGTPSHATKRRYRDARKNFGYAQSNNYIDWSRIARRTTFIWKFSKLDDAVKWVRENCKRDFVKYPESPRGDIAMHYVSKAFGVAISDLLDDQRNVTINVPRVIAIVLCKQSGVTANELARQFRRDAATIKSAIKKHAHLLKEPDNETPNDTGDRRPTSDGPIGEGGPVSS